MRVLVTLALLALPLAGCSAPDAPLRARPGDFVVVDLVAWDAEGMEVLNRTGLRAFAGRDVPVAVPAGWDANATEPLPHAVTDALGGATVGEERRTGLAPSERAFGPWDAARTIAAPVRQRLDREQELPADLPLRPYPGTDCTGDPAAGVCAPPPDKFFLDWANQTWPVTLLARDNATMRVRLDAGPPVGSIVELPDYWNAKYRLWRSQVVDAAPDNLTLEHQPEAGRTVHVGGVPYRILVANGTVLADGNHPLARESLAFAVRLRALAFAPSEANPVAPDAVLVDLDGRRFNLSSLRGKPALVDFYATWCITCKQQAPVLARAHETYGANLTVLSITIDPTDSQDRVRAFQAEVERSSERRADWTFAFDPTGEAAKGLGVTIIPREVLLDADGRILRASTGLHPWPKLEADMAAAGLVASNR